MGVMYFSTARAEELLRTAIAAVEDTGADLTSSLEALEVPVYITDAAGTVTHFNSACIEFTGRQPAAGRDRWCVTWKLFTDDGDFMPHDQCPMAVAIRDRRPVRGVTAIAERPDGTRVNFMPFPTPLLSEDGRLLGAVNLFIDVTDERRVAELQSQAMKCRRLAAAVNDRRATAALTAMADEFDAMAGEGVARLMSRAQAGDGGSSTRRSARPRARG
jgi:hypothetical protein